jgi:hypothetical protein
MSNQSEYSDEDIIRIAKAQKSVMNAICAILLINLTFFFVAQSVGQSVGGGAVAVLFLLEMFIAGFYTFRLDKAMKAQGAMAWIGGVLAGLFALTLVGLVVMAMVSSRATKVLKQRGLKVGFMGVSQQNLDRWQSSNQTK